MILDFGCIFSFNGNGIDYVWGGNVIIMGGVINGG